MTRDLKKMIEESKNEVRENKEKLFRSLKEYSELDYLTKNEEDLINVLKESPAVKFDCRDIINKFKKQIQTSYPETIGFKTRSKEYKL